MILLYIIAKPLAFCLDKLLGHELGTTYSKSEMSKLLEIHVKEGRFNQEVGTAMKGALQYQDMIVKEVMTPLEHTFMISVDDRLNFEMMATIFKTGYSRIPVYESTVGNVIGLLFVKDLIFIDPEDATPVRELMQIFGRSTHDVWPDDKLGDVLRHLKSGHTHMALVRGVCNEEKVDPYYTLEGIITLEDIIEVILGEEIVDETDAWVDVDHTKKVSREKAFDWSRLRLLDAKIVDETLSDDEVRAVAAHLRQNYSCTVSNISDKQLMRMIAATAVTELEEVHKEAGEDLPSSPKLLYEKNKESSICTLILQGKVTVLAGNDNFRSDSSSWSVIATGALTDETYTPDFSAYVSSGPCRCLQFKREIFTAACDASILENIPLKKGLDNGTGMNRKETPLEIDNKTCTIDESGRNVELQTKSTESDRIAASSNHSKADDIVERSEQRGRLLATLFCDFKKEPKDSITEEG
jgi:metal transporter CNNM